VARPPPRSVEAAGIAFTERPAHRTPCGAGAVPGEAGKIVHELAGVYVNVAAPVAVSMCQGEAVLALSVDTVEATRAAAGLLRRPWHLQAEVATDLSQNRRHDFH
jgi:hypothetical protein